MPTRNRNIILAAILGMCLCLTGGALLMPAINAERRFYQLSYTTNLGKNADPKYAWVQSLGSFTGLALDMIWMRVETMKQDGRYHEAMQLSELITRLQPTFPEVWADRAHNLAYNISAAQDDPAERWMWVRAGIDLLRGEGIPFNPRGVTLYQKLSWIFLHKIGQFSDDHHVHYKRWLAEKWSYLLGPQPVHDTEAALASFSAIADAFDQWVNPSADAAHQPLGRAAHAELKRLVDADPEMAIHLGNNRPIALGFDYFRLFLGRVRSELAKRQPKLAAKLARLSELVEEQAARGGAKPIDRLLADVPAAAPLIAELDAMGMPLNQDTLVAIGRAQQWAASPDAKLMQPEARRSRQIALEVDDRLVDWLADEKTAEPRGKLLAFLRARVLAEDYNMDPLWMHDLMVGEWLATAGGADFKAGSALPAPLDWRHPAAHGVYWASLGVRRSNGLLRPQDFDVLNTDRNVVHGLQSMYEIGWIVYDVSTGYYKVMEDSRYIEAYLRAVDGAFERIADVQNRGPERERNDAPKSFLDGQENFLKKVIVHLYLAGDEQRAAEYQAMLRREHGNKPKREIYYYPLQQFVVSSFVKAESINNRQDARNAISSLMARAIMEGMATRRYKQADRYIKLARFLYDTYQARVAEELKDKEFVRQGLVPFEDLFADVFAERFLKNARVPGSVKVRVWAQALEQFEGLCRRIYDQARPTVAAQLKAEKIYDPDKAFPEPPGMEAYRKANPTKAKPTGPDTFLKPEGTSPPLRLKP